jgi:hypothetical protein
MRLPPSYRARGTGISSSGEVPVQASVGDLGRCTVLVLRAPEPTFRPFAQPSMSGQARRSRCFYRQPERLIRICVEPPHGLLAKY